MSADMDLESGAVARMTCAPPSFCSSATGIAGGGVDVVNSAEFAGEGSLSLPRPMANGAEAHLPRVLDAEMAEAADALHGDQIAGARARVAQRVENRDAGAEQRRGFGGRKIVGHGRDRFGGRDHVFGITAIMADGGDFLVLAEHEIAAAAGFASEVMSAMPSDADALAGLPVA